MGSALHLCFQRVDSAVHVGQRGLCCGRVIMICELRAVVKTHCYTRSECLMQSQGSVGVPKAVDD
jgi:hypothetical protein